MRLPSHQATTTRSGVLPGHLRIPLSLYPQTARYDNGALFLVSVTLQMALLLPHIHLLSFPCLCLLMENAPYTIA